VAVALEDIAAFRAVHSIKPLDRHAVATTARATGAVVVAEDHWAEGGLGDAVLAALGRPVYRGDDRAHGRGDRRLKRWSR